MTVNCNMVKAHSTLDCVSAVNVYTPLHMATELTSKSKGKKPKNQKQQHPRTPHAVGKQNCMIWLVNYMQNVMKPQAN